MKNNDIVVNAGLTPIERAKLNVNLTNEKVAKKLIEIEKNRKPIAVPILSEQVREKILELQTPEYREMKKNIDDIFSLFKTDEVKAIERWKNSIINTIGLVNDSELELFSISLNFSPTCDNIIKSVSDKIIESKGNDYFITLLKNDYDLTKVIFQNILRNSIYIFRDLTKELIVDCDMSFMEYLFTINSNSNNIENIFSEMVIEALQFIKVKQDTFWNDKSMKYIELSPDLYEFFLNMSKQYLSGIQKARFDVMCIFKFEFTSRNEQNGKYI